MNGIPRAQGSHNFVRNQRSALDRCGGISRFACQKQTDNFRREFADLKNDSDSNDKDVVLSTERKEPELGQANLARLCRLLRGYSLSPVSIGQRLCRTDLHQPGMVQWVDLRWKRHEFL